jgi:hypothetical protein
MPPEVGGEEWEALTGERLFQVLKPRGWRAER